MPNGLFDLDPAKVYHFNPSASALTASFELKVTF
jgi:hypothetical protein